MSKSKPRANLLDVARHAGVSPATVSRVLNKTAPVRPSVRERVLASCRSLGYEPSPPRSSALSAQTNIVVVLPDILNPFFTEVVRGIQDEAGPDGFLLLLLDTLEDAHREQQALRMLATRSVGGLVLCASRLPGQDLMAFHERHRMPIVLINRQIDHPDLPCILVDFRQATYRAARHLLALNHTRIAYLAGPVASEPSLERRQGIEQALAEEGLCLRPEWCPAGFPGVDGGFQAMSALLALPPADRPTAAIVYNDIMAMGALQAVRAHHLRVPEDISIVGFDDIAMAAHANPPLTTIAQPKYRIGRLAMKILRQMMQGQGALGDGYTLLESSLVLRESTGPAPGSNGHGAAK